MSNKTKKASIVQTTYKSVKTPYTTPELTALGSIIELTQTNKGGPGFDGGTNPFHKCGHDGCPDVS